MLNVVLSILYGALCCGVYTTILPAEHYIHVVLDSNLYLLEILLR
jgi:hypothetical protein